MLAIQESTQAVSSVMAPDVGQMLGLVEAIVRPAQSINALAMSSACEHLLDVLKTVHNYLRGKLKPQSFWRLQEELEDLNEALLSAQNEVNLIAQTNLLVQAFAWRRLSMTLRQSTLKIEIAFSGLYMSETEPQSARRVVYPRCLSLKSLKFQRSLHPIHDGSQTPDIEEVRAKFLGEENDVLLRRSTTGQGTQDVAWHIEVIQALATFTMPDMASLLAHTDKSSRHPWYILSIPSQTFITSDFIIKSYIDRLLFAFPYTLTNHRLQRMTQRQDSTFELDEDTAVHQTCDNNIRGDTLSPPLDEVDQLLRILLSNASSTTINDNTTETSDQCSMATSGQVVDVILRLRNTTVQSVIDHLNKVLDHISPSSGVFAVTSRILQKLCMRQRSLPKLFQLVEADIHKTSDTPIGRGGYATVYLGLYFKMAVALKCFQIHDQSRMQRIHEVFCKEALQWQRLRHQNITPFLGITTRISPLCLVSKWMKYGTIVSYLKNNPDADRLSLIIDVVRGLEYLHSSHLVHGDLKGANVLVDEHSHACLSDFGIATVMYDPDIMQAITKTSGSSGTTRWMAPERLDPESLEDSDYEPRSSDIYSLSMVVWEIYSGKIPFSEYGHEGTVIAQVLVFNVRPQRTEEMIKIGLTDEIWTIVEAGWSANWHARPTLDRILAVFTHAAGSRGTAQQG